MAKPKYLPPDSLSDEDVARLNDVRKQVWKGGALGLVNGSVLGFIASRLGARYSPALRKLSTTNYTMLCVMASGALGSFLGATVSGKKSVVYIGDIFTRGATDQVKTEYQEKAVEAGGGWRAQQQNMEDAMRESHARRMRALELHRQSRDNGATFESDRK
ncbi:hypothetical protein JKP88DRAFT_66468 [Tribonema minus]|uniref:Uncharacterized protein n=1 Tax=Tribonema minus TaxID=303371 RepID=A0A836CCN6_9STRA|nr:hypothetical protein JKP88DRAFT_66468 [Tribonema minus]